MSSSPISAGLAGARRIVVYGVTGSGKSTLAEAIGVATGLPWHPMDELTWEPGWVEVPLELQRERVTAICADDAWVLDAAYGTWIDIPFATAQLVVALDYPRWLSLGRLLRRSVLRVVRRTRICNGNVETVAKLLSRDSIIGWHVTSYARKHARIASWAADPAVLPVLRLTSPGQTRRWLRTVRAQP